MAPRSKKTMRSKKSFKGKRRNYQTNNIVGKSLNPIPQRSIVKMKYAESVLLDVGSSYAYQFNLNSVFDPNRTGIGHQPYGHDTFATMYNRYRVIACSYHVWFPASGAVSYQLSAVPANEVQIFGSIAEARENPRGKFKIQMPGGTAQKISGKVYLPSLTGRTKSQYMADDRYQATVGSSPLELAILNLQSASTSDVASPVTCVVELEYTVEWFDAKILGQS